MRSALVSDQWATIAVRETVCEDHDEVDKRPDAATTRSQQLNHTCADFAYIETVNAEPSQEDA